MSLTHGECDLHSPGHHGVRPPSHGNLGYQIMLSRKTNFRTLRYCAMRATAAILHHEGKKHTKTGGRVKLSDRSTIGGPIGRPVLDAWSSECSGEEASRVSGSSPILPGSGSSPILPGCIVRICFRRVPLHTALCCSVAVLLYCIYEHNLINPP